MDRKKQASANKASERPAGPEAAVALCFRRAAGGLEFLLVRTSSGRRWVFPKGKVEAGESPAQAALREAAEEAGLCGRLLGESLGTYRIHKAKGRQWVSVFLVEVTGRRGEPENFRDPAWFTEKRVVSQLALQRSWRAASLWQKILKRACRVLKKTVVSEDDIKEQS